MKVAFFTTEASAHGERLIPTQATESGWGNDLLRGMAVSGALARGTEQAFLGLCESELRPTRFTLDLFHPPHSVPSVVHTAVIRKGRRLMLIDAFFEQAGTTVARSSTLFLRPSKTPAGQVWSQIPQIELPPAELLPEDNDDRIYFEEGRGWVTSVDAAHEPVRRQSWHFPIPIVEGEKITAFQAVACMGDVSNVISNWGDFGLAHINADVTLTMARLPEDLRMGLSASSRIESEGLSVGSAMLYDAEGVFGMSLVTALANPKHRANPKTRQPMPGRVTP